eukprot:1221488-Prymnesium_polylepis.1
MRLGPIFTDETGLPPVLFGCVLGFVCGGRCAVCYARFVRAIRIGVTCAAVTCVRINRMMVDAMRYVGATALCAGLSPAP